MKFVFGVMVGVAFARPIRKFLTHKILTSIYN